MWPASVEGVDASGCGLLITKREPGSATIAATAASAQDPPNAAATASHHLLQLDGCALSIRRAVVGVPPGTMNVTMSLAAALVSFLTMNVFAPVSVHDCPGL